jgi:hypothetical protein
VSEDGQSYAVADPGVDDDCGVGLLVGVAVGRGAGLLEPPPPHAVTSARISVTAKRRAAYIDTFALVRCNGRRTSRSHGFLMNV